MQTPRRRAAQMSSSPHVSAPAPPASSSRHVPAPTPSAVVFRPVSDGGGWLQVGIQDDGLFWFSGSAPVVEHPPQFEDLPEPPSFDPSVALPVALGLPALPPEDLRTDPI